MRFASKSSLPTSSINDSTIGSSSRTAVKNSHERNNDVYKYYQRAFDQWIENFRSKSKSKSTSQSNSNSNPNKISNTRALIKKILSCDKLYESYCS